jgi:phosphatidate cytidylyltransferase
LVWLTRARLSRLVLRTRLKTASVALPALLGLIAFAPPVAFSVIIAVLAFWALLEIGEMSRVDGWRWPLIVFAGGIPALETLLSGHALPAGWIICLIVFVLMMILVVQVGISGADYAASGALLVVLGAAWVGMFFPYFALLRNRARGVPLIILMLLLAFASDSGAYFVGRFAGRIKLMPRVSPHKTVEGALGGLAAALIAGLILRSGLVPCLSLVSVTLLGLAVGVLAQAGDLANSAFKRIAGVKDSGWIFPGHGGLLDRACSLVFPVVLTYYCVR